MHSAVFAAGSTRTATPPSSRRGARSTPWTSTPAKSNGKVPLGEYPELTRRGLPPTGTENYGGPVVTAGGLIFIGATADETFRAFDKDTGKTLWQIKLPFGGNATPSTYMINGRQYVVISAGGGKSGRPSGGSLVAFALPKTAQ
jgi:quinoprotein glucose dehydrogenase